MRKSYSLTVEKKPISITSAQVGQSNEMPGRMKKYALSMGIRTLCFIGAVITPSPYRWSLVVGAVVLPYFAVVVANAGRETVPTDFEKIESRKPLEW